MRAFVFALAAASSLVACSKRAPPPPPRSVPVDLTKPGSVEVAGTCLRASASPLSFVVVRDGKLRDRAFGKGNLEVRDLALRLTVKTDAGAVLKTWDFDATSGLENVTWRAPDTCIAMQTSTPGPVCDQEGSGLKFVLEVVKGTAAYGGSPAVWVVSEGVQ